MVINIGSVDSRGQCRPDRPANMLLLLVCAFLAASANAYSVPDPTFEVVSPGGLKVSIPDEEGVQAFAFHGNVNRNIGGFDNGQISADVLTRENGKFTFYDKNVGLKNGDVINYWLNVVRDGLGYRLDNGKFIFHDFNEKNRECPPGYRKKVKLESGDRSAGSHGFHQGGYSLQYPRGYHPNGFNPTPQWHHPPNHHWHPQHQYHQGGFGHGYGRSHWHGQQHNFYNQFTPPTAFQTVDGLAFEHFGGRVHAIAKRNTESSDESSGDEDGGSLQSRFGDYGRNFLRPRFQKSYRGHGYGHGYGLAHGHGYGYYQGRRPYRPQHHHQFQHGFPAGPYHPRQPGFGQKPDHGKDEDYYEDCEEDDDSDAASPQPMTMSTSERTSSTSTSTEMPTTTSPSTTTSKMTTTTISTTPFPKIDIRFGGS